ncbi:unnamed protein product [Bursaphelenchus okinawaensis]|uniref:RING-type domain-containing protein n=1 Tax=Bursaphelenchus okinawaensis TaxID=465554 RepID=A0A811KYL4_9BILA|nr:unnamed protein product [Bursaphelenchus okinawaensis]CAG9114344.1 unnamed protein product [Bursaphelenchus okinawaensis]
MVVTPTHRSASSSQLPSVSKRICKAEARVERFGAGRCPYCRQTFVNPVALQCGHSLCELCCKKLLKKHQKYLSPKTVPPPTPSKPLALQQTPKSSSRARQARTPVMGVRTIELLSEYMEKEKVEYSYSPRITVQEELPIKTPSCLVCGAAPSSLPPIKNHALSQVLKALSRRKSKLAAMDCVPEETYRPPSPAPSSASSGFYESDTDIGIKKCNIAVLGASKVGKSQLARTQFLNNLFFGRTDNGLINPVSNFDDSKAKYMLCLADSDDDICKAVVTAQGFVVLYSSTDPESLKRANEVASQICGLTSDKPAIVFAANKIDVKSDVQVNPIDGQATAQLYDAPFFEVSAKDNVNVNALFTDLVRQIDANYKSQRNSEDSS